MVEPLDDPRRVDPPFVEDERESYASWLEYHRATLLLKCEGLDDAGRKARPVETSLLSLHGLVRHMAEVERNWFRRVLDGEALESGIWWNDAHPDGDFELVDDASWDDDLRVWHEQCDLARAIASRHGLDDTGMRRGEPVSLRWIFVHLIEEYARHNGHADLLRELVDGTVGE